MDNILRCYIISFFQKAQIQRICQVLMNVSLKKIFVDLDLYDCVAAYKLFSEIGII